MSQSWVISPAYKNALFVGIENFDLARLKDFRGATTRGDGYQLTLGRRNRYFIHPSPKSEIFILETNDHRSRASCLRELIGFIEGRDGIINRLHIEEQAKALEYFREFQDDIPERKIHVFLGDRIKVSTSKGKVRSMLRKKILYNLTNFDEVEKILELTRWDIRGTSITLDKSGIKHYGFVFIDDDPTARVLIAGNPSNQEIHNDLASRLLEYL